LYLSRLYRRQAKALSPPAGADYILNSPGVPSGIKSLREFPPPGRGEQITLSA